MNYALVTILTVLVAALMLDLVEAYAVQTAARGSAILTVDALNLLLVTGLVGLVLRQVLPIAARLAGGGALSTFGALSGLGRRAAGAALAVADRAMGPPDPKQPELRPAVWRAGANPSPGGVK